jgi:autophagy-related protein 18
MEEESNKILNENPNEILCINFNQDGSCIAIGTETGFKIINTLPFLDVCYQNMGG